MRRILMTAMLVLPMLALSVPAIAGADTYMIDGAHTAVNFKVKHMMVSWVRGKLGDTSGTVQYDPANPEATVVDVTIDVSSIDTRNGKRDDHLRSADFFDAEAHPNARFTSKRVVRGSSGGLELVGDLTIRGVTREVVLKVDEPSAPMMHPMGGTVVGFHATTVIDREDFGLTWNMALETGGLLVGNEVHLEIDAEITKKDAAK
jgi:polyisoprenoid-binding protein YceI